MTKKPLNIVLLLLCLPNIVWMQSASVAKPEEMAAYQKTVQPFLSKNCAACHNDRQKVANLSFNSFGDAAVWEKVLDRLVAGTMPPPGPKPPAKEEIDAVTNWIENVLGISEAGKGPNPGRITARRLNRVEYNNTIRDLLGVSIRPADEFPVDDSGYGFDNNGDVLTVSPMLMEKYMTAAAKVSKLAIFGETLPPTPTRLARLLNRRSPDVTDVLSKGNYFPYSMRGAMYGSWVFPVDAEYEFRLRVANFRPNAKLPRGATVEQIRDAERNSVPPRKVTLSVDGQHVLTNVVEGTTAYDYDRGEFTGRIAVKAGERTLRASFPELADLTDPRLNINPDQRRQLFVDYLEIVGPFNPLTDSTESYKRIFVCGHTAGKHSPACARKVVANLTQRAYRRPVTDQEVNSKLSLVTMAIKDGESFEEAVRVALEAILASPKFLFRMEVPPAVSTVPHLVSDHDLASRLSYFLWASMPDKDLMQRADRGELRKPGVLESQVRRMLADPKAENLVSNFAAQWLQLRILGRTKPDPARFPSVDDELLDAMRRETNLFVSTIIQEDRGILDFIDAPFTFLNGPLARHYGITGVDGEAFRRVELDGEQRGGLLTQGAILTVSSYPTRTSPPVRGKWVLENLMGTAPPPPPPEVPVLDESKMATNMSMRQRLEQHRKDPSCAPCHNAMDPIGFGLERYDAVGAYRTHEGNILIDSSGTLPSGQSFQGVKDLKTILKGESDVFTKNLVTKLMTFALGRGLERYDRSAVEQVSRQAAQNQYKFSTLVMGIVNSKPFQMSTRDGGK